MIFAVIYLAALVAFYFAQRADARVSEEGFARGYGEGNEIITRFFPKPAYDVLVAYNYLQLAVFSAAVAWIPWEYLQYVLVAVTLAAAGKSMMAVRKWRKTFATNGAYLHANLTAWEKFLGM